MLIILRFCGGGGGKDLVKIQIFSVGCDEFCRFYLAVVDGAEDCEDEEGEDYVDSDLEAKPSLGIEGERRGRPLKQRDLLND